MIMLMFNTVVILMLNSCQLHSYHRYYIIPLLSWAEAEEARLTFTTGRCWIAASEIISLHSKAGLT